MLGTWMDRIDKEEVVCSITPADIDIRIEVYKDKVKLHPTELSEEEQCDHYFITKNEVIEIYNAMRDAESDETSSSDIEQEW